MKKLCRIIFALLFVTLNISAQKRTPTFGQYPAKVEQARVRGIDFKRNPDARSFKTRLSEALKGGVNFAGHFAVAGRGSGTGCISGGIINTAT